MAISNDTKITVGVMITLAGVIFWVGIVYAKVNSNAETNEKQEKKIEEIYQIKTDIALIKQALGIKDQGKGN